MLKRSTALGPPFQRAGLSSGLLLDGAAGYNSSTCPSGATSSAAEAARRGSTHSRRNSHPFVARELKTAATDATATKGFYGSSAWAGKFTFLFQKRVVSGLVDQLRQVLANANWATNMLAIHVRSQVHRFKICQYASPKAKMERICKYSSAWCEPWASVPC